MLLREWDPMACHLSLNHTVPAVQVNASAVKVLALDAQAATSSARLAMALTGLKFTYSGNRGGRQASLSPGLGCRDEEERTGPVCSGTRRGSGFYASCTAMCSAAFQCLGHNDDGVCACLCCLCVFQ